MNVQVAERELNNNKGNNVPKYKAMMCQPEEIRSGMSEEAVGQGRIGRGEKYKESIRLQISCPYCGVELITGSIMEHHRQMNRTDTEIN